ncbi:multidrug MFS transporter [Ammoniphilus oxalaticus]|uniref:Multidrug MFS transporter n=1 Tax=Ammoniphilus oxalaticus TaxID=66863 RepID=A0A419SNQ0_9BACL|nr:MFS transporter [Ammoniphilus oxalaticus]RKD25905.1 multidrug MFS transporter [Ammoniphilus oxalaticus]
MSYAEQSVKEQQHGPNRNRWLILANVSLGTFMSTLDGSIANVALPNISAIMNAPLHQVQWVLTAYLLTICATLPIIGNLSDRWGRSRVYNYGFLVFVLGSIGCALSSSLAVLIMSRIFQAIGASCLMSNSQAIVAEIFTTQRGQALGIIGTVVSIGSLTGPGIGGVLVQHFGWGSIFWINVPIGIAAFIAGWFILPKTNTIKDKRSFDYFGSFLFAFGMTAFLYTFSHAEDWGWQSGRFWSLFIVSAATLVVFYFWERRIRFPMLDFSLYRIPAFAIGNVTATLSFISLSCTTVMMPFYMQNVLQFTPSLTGYVMIAYPLTMAIVAPLSGGLSDKIGSYALTTGGLVINAIGFALLTGLGLESSAWVIAFHLMVFGVGAGMFHSPNNASIMGSVPKAKLGTAGGLNALVRNIGMVLGISASVSLFSYRFGNLTDGSGSMLHLTADLAPQALRALHLVFWVAAAVCMVGAFLSAVRMKKKI